MDAAIAAELARPLIGPGMKISDVQERAGKLYVLYIPEMDDSPAVGGNMPIEVDPSTGTCRAIGIDEVFELDL